MSESVSRKTDLRHSTRNAQIHKGDFRNCKCFGALVYVKGIYTHTHTLTHTHTHTQREAG